MKKRNICAIMSSVLMVFAGMAAATETCLRNQTKLSYVNTDGNTKTENLAVRNELTYDFTAMLSASWKLGALYGKTDGERTAENYMTELRLTYDLSEQFYAGVLGGWFKNKFAGLEARYHVGPILGVYILKGDKNNLKLEVGVDYVKEKYMDDTDDDFARGRSMVEYAYAFNNKNKFTQTVEYLFDFDESDKYQVNSISAVTSAFSDNMSLKASYEIKYNNMPPINTDGERFEYADRTLGVTLVIDY